MQKFTFFLLLLALVACSPAREIPAGAAQMVVANRPTSEPITINQNITVVMPTPVAVAAVSTETMTEEELLLALDTAMVEASAATAESATVTTAATADDTLSAEEVATIEIYVANADTLAAQAVAYLESYEAQYAEAAVAELAAISAELTAINESLTLLNETVASIDQTLTAGLELAEESIATLEAAAAQAQATATTAQANAQIRADEIRTLVDENVTGEMADQAQLYFDALDAALADGTLDETEMAALVALGEQVSAELTAQGYTTAALRIANSTQQLQQNNGQLLIDAAQNRPNRRGND